MTIIDHDLLAGGARHRRRKALGQGPGVPGGPFAARGDPARRDRHRPRSVPRARRPGHRRESGEEPDDGGGHPRRLSAGVRHHACVFETIVLGAFTREGRRISMLVNVGRTAYAGHLCMRGRTSLDHPRPGESAAVGRARVDGSTGLDIALAPRAAVLLVEERRKASPWPEPGAFPRFRVGAVAAVVRPEILRRILLSPPPRLLRPASASHDREEKLRNASEMTMNTNRMLGIWMAAVLMAGSAVLAAEPTASDNARAVPAHPARNPTCPLSGSGR